MVWNHETWRGIMKLGLGAQNAVWDYETWSGNAKGCLGLRKVVWDLEHGLGSQNITRDPENGQEICRGTFECCLGLGP